MPGDAVAVIPARFASSRFPGKPLVPLLGRPMLLWVAETCAEALGGANVLVATDDERIRQVVVDAGLRAELTSAAALTGTDRIAELVDRLDRPIVLNVQGDEPLLDPNDILLVAATKREHPDDVVNGYHAVGPEEDPTSVNLPKVAIDRDGMLLYMSRSLLPGTKSGAVDRSVEYLKQVCIYGYSAEDLRRFAATEGKGPLEQAEDIEILRFLELGQRVRMVRTAGSSLAVDVPEDVAIVEAALRRRGLGA